jgi:hypothetical protein
MLRNNETQLLMATACRRTFCPSLPTSTFYRRRQQSWTRLRVKLLLDLHESNLIGAGNHHNLRHLSVLLRLRLHEEVGAGGIFLTSVGGNTEPNEMSSLNDEEEVVFWTSEQKAPWSVTIFSVDTIVTSRTSR